MGTHVMKYLFDDQTKRKTEEMFCVIEAGLNDQIGLKWKENEEFGINPFLRANAEFKMLYCPCRRKVFGKTFASLIRNAFEFEKVAIRMTPNYQVFLKCC